MHITELVYLYGDKAIEKVYEEIDQRLNKFRNWLSGLGDLSERQRDNHLANCHIMIEFMAEDSPCIFPEEVCDGDDTPHTRQDETSTSFGLKQFVYNSYIRKGPLPGELTDCILQSISLYYRFLLETDEVHRIPDLVEDVVYDRPYFQERLERYHSIQSQYPEDDQAWLEAFQEWENEI